MNGTSWLPGIVVLGVGLLAAAVYVVRTLARSRATGAGTEAARRAAEAEARYRSAIDRLRELKAERHNLTEQAYETQRAELEKRAADALRARESQVATATARVPEEAIPAGAPAAAGTGFFGRHPEWKGALWGGGVVAFFGALFFYLSSESKPADAGGQGRGPMQTQGPPAAGPDGEHDHDHQKEMDQALQHVREHPEDLAAASELVHDLIGHQAWMDAFQVTERALGVDPFHLEHRIHRAVLKTIRGELTGTEELQLLADTYPDAEEALLFLASAAMQQGNKARALGALERYVTVTRPDQQSAEIFQAIAQLRQELGHRATP